MNGSESLQNDQSGATEDALRRAVDTTPAFIHTARPDGYLDYFNRGWLDFLGKSLEDVGRSRDNKGKDKTSRSLSRSTKRKRTFNEHSNNN
jgi:hypothetical protein